MDKKETWVTFLGMKPCKVEYSRNGEGFNGTIFREPVTTFTLYFVDNNFAIHTDPRLDGKSLDILGEAIKKLEKPELEK